LALKNSRSIRKREFYCSQNNCCSFQSPVQTTGIPHGCPHKTTRLLGLATDSIGHPQLSYTTENHHTEVKTPDKYTRTSGLSSYVAVKVFPSLSWHLRKRLYTPSELMTHKSEKQTHWNKYVWRETRKKERSNRGRQHNGH